jgi:signal transduction histidine kinase
MSAGETDPKWPKLLSLAAHELRSPLTVVGGYIRMLLKDRAGPLTEQQRRLMEEAEKSCGRLSMLVAEVSELAHLESGKAAFNRSTVDVQTILADTIRDLPELPDRTVSIDLMVDEDVPPAGVQGDPVRLKAAFSAILNALRREIVASDRLSVRLQTTTYEDRPVLRILIGEAVRIDQLASLTPADLGTFDEWRGGNGLALPAARRIIETHGGHITSPSDDGKAGAIVTVPRAPIPETSEHE